MPILSQQTFGLRRSENTPGLGVMQDSFMGKEITSVHYLLSSATKVQPRFTSVVPKSVLVLHNFFHRCVRHA